MIEHDAFNGLVILTKFMEIAGAGAIVRGLLLPQSGAFGRLLEKKVLTGTVTIEKLWGVWC
jgi:hypothetical protein